MGIRKIIYGHFGSADISVPLGRPGMSAIFFSKFFFHFFENYFPEFLHLIDLFNEYLCFIHI